MMPRWLGVVAAIGFWTVGVPIVHGVVPWWLANTGHRLGWSEGHAAAWNMLGLAPVALGAGGLLWVMASHLRRTPEQVPLRWMPEYLLESGPYRWSRNPMYAAELLLWFGWAILYGSVTVLAGAIALWVAISVCVLPWEERALEARFGEAYREYKKTVPRWLELPHRCGGGPTTRCS
jgi:protein-S-isoprenylcysteine O-methyltransferase Ste14